MVFAPPPFVGPLVIQLFFCSLASKNVFILPILRQYNIGKIANLEFLIYPGNVKCSFICQVVAKRRLDFSRGRRLFLLNLIAPPNCTFVVGRLLLLNSQMWSGGGKLGVAHSEIIKKGTLWFWTTKLFGRFPTPQYTLQSPPFFHSLHFGEGKSEGDKWISVWLQPPYTTKIPPPQLTTRPFPPRKKKEELICTTSTTLSIAATVGKGGWETVYAHCPPYFPKETPFSLSPN